MTEEEIREQKLQLCEQYGITEEQIDAAVAAIRRPKRIARSRC